MRGIDANANSNADRDQAVPAENAGVSTVGAEANDSDNLTATNLLAVADVSSSFDVAAAYARRRWSPFALRSENGTALTWIVGVLSTFAFVAAITSRGVEGYGSVAVESDASPRLIVDVSTAEWTDFALLPGVGRTLARRMVEARDAADDDLGPETFEAVRGVGPKTWRRIEPYLQFHER